MNIGVEMVMIITDLFAPVDDLCVILHVECNDSLNTRGYHSFDERE